MDSVLATTTLEHNLEYGCTSTLATIKELYPNQIQLLENLVNRVVNLNEDTIIRVSIFQKGATQIEVHLIRTRKSADTSIQKSALLTVSATWHRRDTASFTIDLNDENGFTQEVVSRLIETIRRTLDLR